jgi:hypothetical protein
LLIFFIIHFLISKTGFSIAAVCRRRGRLIAVTVFFSHLKTTQHDRNYRNHRVCYSRGHHPLVTDKVAAGTLAIVRYLTTDYNLRSLIFSCSHP